MATQTVLDPTAYLGFANGLPLFREHRQALIAAIGGLAHQFLLSPDEERSTVRELVPEGAWYQHVPRDPRHVDDLLINKVGNRVARAMIGELLARFNALTTVCPLGHLGVGIDNGSWTVRATGERCLVPTCRETILWEPPPVSHYDWVDDCLVSLVVRDRVIGGCNVPIHIENIERLVNSMGGLRPEVEQVLSIATLQNRGLTLKKLLGQLWRTHAVRYGHQPLKVLWSFTRHNPESVAYVVDELKSAAFAAVTRQASSGPPPAPTSVAPRKKREKLSVVAIAAADEGIDLWILQDVAKSLKTLKDYSRITVWTTANCTFPHLMAECLPPQLQNADVVLLFLSDRFFKSPCGKEAERVLHGFCDGLFPFRIYLVKINTYSSELAYNLPALVDSKGSRPSDVDTIVRTAALKLATIIPAHLEIFDRENA